MTSCCVLLRDCGWMTLEQLWWDGGRRQRPGGHWTLDSVIAVTSLGTSDHYKHCLCQSSWSWAARVAETLSRTSAATVRTGSSSPPGTPRSPPPSSWRSLTRLDAEMGGSWWKKMTSKTQTNIRNDLSPVFIEMEMLGSTLEVERPSARRKKSKVSLTF